MPKPQISPGQGLLLLMKHFHADEATLNYLKKLYLNGAVTAEDDEEIRRLLSDEILEKYEVIYDAKSINDDPTRRYFETHLAYETLVSNLDKINIEELREHVAAIRLIPPEEEVRLTIDDYVDPIFNGEYDSRSDEFEIEFASYIEKIRSGSIFKELSSEDKEKIELLIKSAVLGVATINFAEFPLDIYGRDSFSSTSRGKRIDSEQLSTRSHFLGLLKGHMPLARDDLAYDKAVTAYTRPADQAGFEPDSSWVKSNFARLVHPFSNSISGTELAQLRVIAKLRNDGRPGFSISGEKMALFHQLFTSALLFGSGGHTLYEFSAPLALAVVKKEFETTPGFEDINLESLYLAGNETSFNLALQDTIDYNQNILLRKNLHLGIENRESKESNMAWEQVELKRKLIDIIQSKIFLNSEKQEKKRFKLFCCRMRKDKEELPNSDLTTILIFIKNNQITQAQIHINELKEMIAESFKTKKMTGDALVSYKFLDFLEKELMKYPPDSRRFAPGAM